MTAIILMGMRHQFCVSCEEKDQRAWDAIRAKRMGLTHKQLLQAMMALWNDASETAITKALSKVGPRGTFKNGRRKQPVTA